MKLTYTLVATIFTSAIAITQAPLAHAGGERGNGGHVVVCPVAQTHPQGHVRFYDYDETTSPKPDGYGYKFVTPTGQTLPEKVESFISRLDARNPNRAHIYRQWAKGFFAVGKEAETAYVNGKLPFIADVGEGAYDPNCELDQLIIQEDQNERSLPGHKRYTISNYYWKMMNTDQQAIAVMHELALREARENKSGDDVVNSGRARYFNALIISHRINTNNYNDKEWVDLFKLQLGYRYTDVNGLPLVVNAERYSYKYSPRGHCEMPGDCSIEEYFSAEPEFFENGRLKSGHFAINQYLRPSYTYSTPYVQISHLKMYGQYVATKHNFLEILFYPNGAIAKLQPPEKPEYFKEDWKSHEEYEEYLKSDHYLYYFIDLYGNSKHGYLRAEINGQQNSIIYSGETHALNLQESGQLLASKGTLRLQSPDIDLDLFKLHKTIPDFDYCRESGYSCEVQFYLSGDLKAVVGSQNLSWDAPNADYMQFKWQGTKYPIYRIDYKNNGEVECLSFNPALKNIFKQCEPM